jgi:hypothetical protein
MNATNENASASAIVDAREIEIPFPGFYESVLSAGMDHAEEMEALNNCAEGDNGSPE